MRHSEPMSSPGETASSAVPIWPALVIPVLRALQHGGVLHRKDIADRAAGLASIGPEARSETLLSGGLRYEQRFGWALSNLTKASWVDRASRGHYQINEAGLAALAEHSEALMKVRDSSNMLSTLPTRRPAQTSVVDDSAPGAKQVR